MRRTLCLALTIALGTLLPLPVHAQAQTFSYTEGSGGGSGTLTLVDLYQSDASTIVVQAGLNRGGIALSGVGVRHVLEHGFYTLDFLLQDAQRQLRFYTGGGLAGAGNSAQGAFFYINSPGSRGQWEIKSGGGGNNPPSDGSTEEALKLINEQRRANGRAELTRVPELDAVAALYAKEYVTSPNPSSDLSGRMMSQGYIPRSVGLILGAGYSAGAGIVAIWKGNAFTNAYLLRTDVRDCGIAVVNQPGSTFGYYWCLVLGAR